MGARSINIYNDAYIPVLGKRHPGALGRPARELWKDVWPAIEPQILAVMERGEATWNERLLLVTDRNGYPENAYFTYSHSPVFEDDGRVAGLICVVSEQTKQVNAESRQSFLVALEEAWRNRNDPREIVGAAVAALGTHLGANRVGFGYVLSDDETIVLETSYTDGVEPLTGAFPISAFGPENIARQRQGITVVHEDVADSPSENQLTWETIDTRSFVSVPLIRSGRFSASLYVNQREPRHWAPDELNLIEDVAARLWDAVERARSEAQRRQSDEKYRSLFQNLDDGFCVVEVLFDADGRAHDYKFLEANSSFERHTGSSANAAVGRTVREFAPTHEEHWFESMAELSREQVYHRVSKTPLGLWAVLRCVCVSRRRSPGKPGSGSLQRHHRTKDGRGRAGPAA